MDSVTLLIGLAVGCFVLAARRHPELLRMHPDAAGNLTKTQDTIIALLALGAYLIAWSVDMPKIAGFLSRNPWSLVPLLWLAWWAAHQGARVMVKRLFIAFLVTSFVKIGSSFKSECWSAHTDLCPFGDSLHEFVLGMQQPRTANTQSSPNGIAWSVITFSDFGTRDFIISPHQSVKVKFDYDFLDRMRKKINLRWTLVDNGDPTCIYINYSNLVCPKQGSAPKINASEYSFETKGKPRKIVFEVINADIEALTINRRGKTEKSSDIISVTHDWSEPIMCHKGEPLILTFISNDDSQWIDLEMRDEQDRIVTIPKNVDRHSQLAFDGSTQHQIIFDSIPHPSIFLNGPDMSVGAVKFVQIRATEEGVETRLRIKRGH